MIAPKMQVRLEPIDLLLPTLAHSTGGTINWLIKSAVPIVHQSMWPRFSLIA